MNRNVRLYIKSYFQDHFHKNVILYGPQIWLFLFLFLPFLIILKISFAENILNLPPISNLVEFLDDGVLKISLSYQNYVTIFTDPFYINALTSSLSLAFVSTGITLIMGYMMAYAMYRFPKKYHYLLLLLIMLPFWTSFLVRVYAWMNMLNSTGLLNQILLSLYIIKEPLYLLDTKIAVIFGIVYCYLPFMVFPIFSSLEKIDPSYSEAAFDLGATPWQVFWRITVPLSYPGIISGCVLVFMPAIGEFVLPELLGGPDTFTIGRALWMEFFNNRNWPLACALAVLIVLPILFISILLNKIGEDKKERV
ncbi:MAG: ABC transporter permease subunit [Proteobacteria bacterium]|nr:ABC transporter permease subunit [Pseudomonadota bacterium]